MEMINFHKINQEALENFNSKHFDKAIYLFTKCLFANHMSKEEMSTIYTNISTCYFFLFQQNKKISDLKEAERTVDEALNLNQSNFKAIFRKAKICEIEGQTENSITYYKKCLKLGYNEEISFLLKWNEMILNENELRKKDEVKSNKGERRNSKIDIYKSWAFGLSEEEMYEWLVDCYRLRKDDENVYQESPSGIYESDSNLSILLDFYVFAVLIKIRKIIPSNFEWTKFIKKAKLLINSTFEQSDASEKYNGENVLSAAHGARSLRFTGSIIYGRGYESVYSEKDYLTEVIHNLLDKSEMQFKSDLDKHHYFFNEVGGVALWKDLLSAINIHKN
jgi:tetratricopeptide (TPR) repeat protein